MSPAPPTYRNDPRTQQSTQDFSALDWARRAVTARKEGAFDLSLECCRQAVRMAPMNVAYRELMAGILYERIEEKLKTGAQPQRPRVRPEPAFAPQAPQQAYAPQRPQPPMSGAPTQDDPWMAARRQQALRAMDPAYAAVPDEDFDGGGTEADPSSTGGLFGATPTPRGQVAPPRRPVAMRGTRLPVGRPSWVKPAALAAACLIVVAGAAGIYALTSDARDRQSSSQPALPDELQAQLAEAGKALTSGNSQRAIEVLRDARKDFPIQASVVNERLVAALVSEGERLASRKRHSDAIKMFEEATTIMPTNADTWVRLGMANREAARASGDRATQRRFLASAETAYLKAIDRRDDFAAARLGLGQVYQAQNDKTKAIEQFQMVARENRGSPEARTAETQLASLSKR